MTRYPVPGIAIEYFGIATGWPRFVLTTGIDLFDLFMCVLKCTQFDFLMKNKITQCVIFKDVNEWNLNIEQIDCIPRGTFS